MSILSFCICQFAEVEEQLPEVYFLNTCSWILYNYLEWNVIFFLFVNLFILNLVSLNFIALIFLGYYFLIKALLSLNRVNLNLYASHIIWKFKSIWQEIQNNLRVPTFVSVDVFNKRVEFFVNLQAQVDIFFICHVAHVFKRSLYSFLKIKHLVIKLKLHLLWLSQVHHVVNQIC